MFPDPIIDVKPSDLARFIAKVDTSGECWLWTGYVNKWGYGDTSMAQRLPRAAHVAAHVLFVGPVAPGLQVDHVYERGCRHRHCVRPDHLEAVTKKENLLRGHSPLADKARQTHCIHGHPFDEVNTYVSSQGRRMCRTCLRNRIREHHRKHPRDRRKKAA
jgi:hypothetical protein